MITETKVIPKSIVQSFNDILINVEPSEESLKRGYRNQAKKEFIKKNPLNLSPKRTKHKIKRSIKRRVLMLDFMENYAQERWDTSMFNPNFWTNMKRQMPVRANQTMRFLRQSPEVKDYPRVI